MGLTGWIQFAVGTVMTVLVGIYCIRKGDQSLRATSKAIMEEFRSPKLSLYSIKENAVANGLVAETVSIEYTIRNVGLSSTPVNHMYLQTTDKELLGKAKSYSVSLAVPEGSAVMHPGEFRTFTLAKAQIDLYGLENIEYLLESKPGELWLMIQDDQGNAVTKVSDLEMSGMRSEIQRLIDCIKAKSTQPSQCANS